MDLVAPPGFVLSCANGTEAPLIGDLPNGSACSGENSTLRIALPAPAAWAPQAPSLLAGVRYSFAVYCENPPPATAAAPAFALRLLQTWPEPEPRLLEMRPDLPAPALGAPLRSFVVEAERARLLLRTHIDVEFCRDVERQRHRCRSVRI